MPTRSNHTHCQVAQKSRHTNQNLSKSMAAQRTGRLRRRKHENLTTYKNNAGKLGIVTYSQFVNFGCKIENMSC